MTFADPFASIVQRLSREYNASIIQSLFREYILKRHAAKYHKSIKRCINNAAGNGLTLRRINFDRDDFKENHDGGNPPHLIGGGYPSVVLTKLLAEMCNPESKYLPIAVETSYLWNEGDKMHFQGVKCDVWNNKAFTVAFTW